MAKKKQNFPTLDLHGKPTSEVPDLVDRFLSKHANQPRVCIMPGKGTGAVKKALVDYLKLGHFPWEYETLPNGNKNLGSIIIILE